MPKNIEGIDLVNKALARASVKMLEDVKTVVEITTQKAVVHAKSNHYGSPGRFETQTGNLVQSIQANPVKVIPGELVEGSFSAGMEYARGVEEGTRPHTIEPRNKKALWWPGASHPMKSVNHPGTRPLPFMFPAALAVQEFFKRAVKAALHGGITPR